MKSKPQITLKNIKHSASLSQETYAYSASIYVDGKRFATVSNPGHGGCDEVHPTFSSSPLASVAELEKRIAETYPRKVSDHPSIQLAFPDGREESLEGLCCDLVTEYLHKKEFRKTLKKVAFVEDGKIYTLPMAATPISLACAARARWSRKVVFLNNLPEAEAFELFKAHA